MLFSVGSAPFTLTWPGARILAVGARGVIKSESSQCLEMLSQAARVEWGPVLPRSTNHQVSIFVSLVYTKYISGINQLYTNVKVYTWYIPRIYKIYTWYIPGISPTWVYYTCYIPGIYRLYVNLGDIAGIYHTKTSIHLFGTSHVPPSTGHIPEIYQVYD